jgi:serine/threonine protein kinase
MADVPSKKPTGLDKTFAFLAPPERPDEIGRLGEYRVLKLLGKGGMGMVFKAEDPQLERAIALKIMLPQVAESEACRERFLREARAAAKLEHDHVIAIYQVGCDRGIPFIAMPFLKGMSLEDWLRRNRPLKMPQILRIGREIARGLQAAHDRGLVHRDIKPANLWLDAATNGRIKILDFGLARPEKEDAGLTRSGQIVGTPNYMSPEQAEGKKIDGRSDLFSLGVVLYRLCTGVLPFRGPNIMAVLMALATQDPPPAGSLNSELPPAFSDLIARLMRKNPDERPASAKEVVDAIAAIERERSRTQTARTDLNVTPPTVVTDSVRAPASQTFHFEESGDSYLSDEDFEAAGRGNAGKDARAGSGRLTWLRPALYGAAGLCVLAFVSIGALFAMSRLFAPPVETAQAKPAVDPPEQKERAPVAKKSDGPTAPKVPPTPIAPVAISRPLFNGKDLDGWKHEPKTWHVENGEIVGDSRNLPSSHELIAPGRYGDFELTFEAKTTFGAYDHTHLLLRIDPVGDPVDNQNPQALAVGMESMSNVFTMEGFWRFKNVRPATTAMQNVRKSNDYNAFAIRFADGQLTVRINGADSGPVKAPIRGDVRLSWHISDKAPDLHLRNLRIVELRPPLVGDWESLMTGFTLDKWWATITQPAGIYVFSQDGPTIRFKTIKDGAKENYLASKKLYGSHHLKLEFQLLKGTKPPRFSIGPAAGSDFGCRLNFSDQQAPWINAWWAQLVEGTIENGAIVRKRNGRISDLRFAVEAPIKVGDWNRFEMIRLNDGIVYVLNGRILGTIAELRKATALEQTDVGPTMINLLVGSGDVNVRRIQIREIRILPPEILELAQ